MGERTRNGEMKEEKEWSRDEGKVKGGGDNVGKRGYEGGLGRIWWG